MFRLLRWLAALFVTSSAVAAEPDKPKAKLPLGKDTTLFTEPLDKDGYVDYETALNEQLRGKIKPADNAVVLLMQAIGPKPEGKELPPTFYKWLGTEPPPEKGEYLVPMTRFFEKELKADPAAFGTRQRQLFRSPWKAADDERHVVWLAANEKPLALAVEASKRTSYFHPLVAPHLTGGFGVLMATPLLASQAREIAGLLQLRTALRACEGKAADAWDDVFTLFRLARLLSQGGTLVEWLVAAACEHIAMDSTVMLLEHARPSAKEARELGERFAKLPSAGAVVPKLNLSERAICNDFLQSLFRDGLQTLDNFKVAVERKTLPTENDAAFREAVDWELLFEIRRGDFERITVAFQLPTHAEREKAWATLLDQTVKATEKVKGLSLDLKTFRGVKSVEDRRTFTTKFSNSQNTLPATLKQLCDVTYRTEQKRANLTLAFALAEHHADTGKYPAALADLKPKYMKAVPDDLFTGQPLKYTKTDSGYLLYSVGVNGKDDGGKFYADTPPGDDLGVRMPREQSK